MSNDNKPSIVDSLTSATLATAKSSGMIKGAAVSAIGVFLLSTTFAVPEEWEQEVQWIFFGLIVIGALKIAIELFRSEKHK